MRTPATLYQIVDLLIIRREFREVFGGIKMDNRKNIHFPPTVFVVQIKGVIERFKLYSLADDVTNDFKITPVEWYIFSTANNVICQSIRSVDEPDIVWLILRAIPDLHSVDIIDRAAFLPERKGGVEIDHLLAPPPHLSGKVPAA
jgi:hypothetical protein